MTHQNDASAMPALDHAALFLDFDGTLVDIASRPDGVTLASGMEDVLGALHRRTNGRVAIVSGRRLDQLEQIMPSFQGVLIGSHGAESRIGGVHEIAADGDRAAFLATRDMLRAWVGYHEGVLLEEKPVSLVLHYRQAPEEEGNCTGILAALSQVLPGFAVRPSKMAMELMPQNVSKKEAVLGLLKDWTDRTPVAIGDDRTDEDMFAAAESCGGFGIKVGEGETSAQMRLDGVEEVHALLKNWLETPEDLS